MLKPFEIAEVNGNKITGRNGDFLLEKGDIFERISWCEFTYPISLIIEEIESYDKKLDNLGEGMSGTLTLNGKGLELLKVNWVLEKDELRDEYDFSKLKTVKPGYSALTEGFSIDLKSIPNIKFQK